MDRSQLLKEVGFLKKDGETVDEEVLEVIDGTYEKTGFPSSLKHYQLSWEVFDLSLEEPYFWVLDTLKTVYPKIEKLEDSFAAAENSAFFGVTQQRLGAQQDRVSQFLATSGKMIKELFQMVRELRIIDERLNYYKDVQEQLEKPLAERGRSAEITLKGMFVDLVQGGGKSAASVYGMARELEFITLPDLFFDAPPFKTAAELENHVKHLKKDFNENVLRVLERHLRQYWTWRDRTYDEHKSRMDFMLSYLLQHFEIIKMYIQWIKPYLGHVSKLTLKEKNMLSPDIVSAFEGSMLDVELLASKRDPSSGANSCVLATFSYRTRPELKVVQEGYQRGPVHIGKFEMHLRAYGWSDEQLEKYKKLKEKEILLLIGDISATVQSAMEALGKELDKYLEQARQKTASKKEERKEEKKSAKKSLTETLFGDFYTPRKKGSSAPAVKQPGESALSAAGGNAKVVAWNVYNNFKKSHKMITW